MTIELSMNILIFVCSLVASIYGIYAFFISKRVLYSRMAVGGILCLMLSSLYQIIYIVSQGEMIKGFNIGILGLISSFMFFFSANFEQMDGLVDDKTKKFRSTRLKALIAPLVVLIIYCIFLFSAVSIELKIVYGVVAFFAMLCIYYSFKHLIIYDVELGMVKVLRPYNALVVLYTILIMIEPIGIYLRITPVYIGSCVGTGIVILVLLPVLKGGIEKWII